MTPGHEPSSFFVSYSHTDQAYVQRLVRLLRQSGLPAWFDLDLAWGASFPRDIQQRISRALGIIVVMSPAAAGSDWVEREILEGQRYDRVFLPILLSGERLFLLASANFFDARTGALPGERELAQLQAIRDKDPFGAEAHPPLVLPKPVRPAPVASQGTGGADALPKLYAYLADGLLEHADLLTTALVLAAAGRSDSGWLRARDGERLPASLLRRIDRAWAEHSGGRHGFSAQLAHQRGRDGRSDLSVREFAEFAVSVGWKRSRQDVSERYGSFIHAGTGQAGFYPTLRNPQQTESLHSWYDQWMRTVIAVHSRLRQQGW